MIPKEITRSQAIFMALLEAMQASGDDGQKLVDGAILAVHDFIEDNAFPGQVKNMEWDRVAKLLIEGNKAVSESNDLRLPLAIKPL